MQRLIDCIRQLVERRYVHAPLCHGFLCAALPCMDLLSIACLPVHSCICVQFMNIVRSSTDVKSVQLLPSSHDHKKSLSFILQEFLPSTIKTYNWRVPIHFWFSVPCTYILSMSVILVVVPNMTRAVPRAVSQWFHLSLSLFWYREQRILNA